MTKPGFPFTSSFTAELKTDVENIAKEANNAITNLFFASVQAILLGLVGFVEYEIIFRLFDYMAGEEGYWNPYLMACTTLSMITGYHLLAENAPNNIAYRFVSKSVGVVIIAYLIGIAVVISTMVIGGGIGEISEGSGSFEYSSTAPEKSLLDTIADFIGGTVGTTAFAVGIGGLAILNLHITHFFIKNIRRSLSVHLPALRNARHFKKLFRKIENATEAYEEHTSDLADLEMQNSDSALLTEAVTDCEKAILSGVSSHQGKLAEMNYSPASSPFSPAPKHGVDGSKLETFIKDLKRFDANFIRKAILSYQPTEK